MLAERALAIFYAVTLFATATAFFGQPVQDVVGHVHDIDYSPVEDVQRQVDELYDAYSPVEDVQQQVDELYDEVKELATTVETSSKAIDIQQTKISANTQLSMSNSKYIATNEKIISGNDEDIAAIKRANSNLRKYINKLKEDIGKLNSQDDELYDEVKQLATTVETNSKVINMQQTKMSANNQLSMSISRDIATNEKTISDYSAAIKNTNSQLKKDINKLQKDIGKLNSQNDEQYDEMKQLVETNSKVINTQQTKISANTQLSMSNSKEIAATEKSISGNDKDTAKIKHANCNLKRKIKKMENKFNSLGINKLRKDINKLNSQDDSIPSSCQDLKKRRPHSPSGDYIILTPGGDPTVVHCKMDHAFCGEGEWMRVGHLDMQNPLETCPAQFRLYQQDDKRSCGRPVGGPGCTSITFPTNGIRYSQVCGRVSGYQYASPDAVDPRIGTGHNDINAHYVDGVSITHGRPSRTHIWTYIAGVTENGADNYRCPCNEGSSAAVQTFIGDSYYCESGAPTSWGRQLYTDDVLWDGEQCGGLEGSCCQSQDLPWFKKALGGETSNDIELRICADQHTNDEDVPISLYEIYIK